MSVLQGTEKAGAGLPLLLGYDLTNRGWVGGPHRAFTLGQKGWPDPPPRVVIRIWVVVADPRAEFGRSQGTKQEWPGRGPVRVCRWRGLSQAGVLAQRIRTQ